MSALSDTKAIEDRMGFKPSVDALAEFLMSPNTKPPLTVAIEGEWGSGKSSFLAQLKAAIALEHERLQSRNEGPIAEPKIVQFDAWRHEKDEALWASFAISVVKGLTPHQWFRRLQLDTKLFCARLEPGQRVAIKALLAGGLLLVGIVCCLIYPRLLDPQADLVRPSIITLISTAAALQLGWIVPFIHTLWRFSKTPLLNAVKSLRRSPYYEEKVGFLDRFHTDFELCLKTYGGNRRLFVFIDDLDRCEVPKAAELLQAVNLLLAGSHPFIAVLAIDRVKIAAGIAARHKDLIPFLPKEAKEHETASNYGSGFLEKFVQLWIRVPHLSVTSIRNYVRSLTRPALAIQLSDAPPQPEKLQKQDSRDPVDRDPPVVEEMVALVAPALNYNPRRLKQFLNLLRYRYFLAQRLAMGTWTIPKLAKIAAIELRWPRVFELILQKEVTLENLYKDAKANKSSNATIEELIKDKALVRVLTCDSASGQASDFTVEDIQLFVPYGSNDFEDDDDEISSR